jgi:hypothetical protein
MITLTNNLLLAKNAIGRNAAAIVLAEVTLNDATVLRWARNTENVVYPATGGETYTAKDFTPPAVPYGSPGRLDSATLVVNDTDRSLEQYMAHAVTDTCKFRGGTVKITVVDSSLLDEAATDMEITFTIASSPARRGNTKVFELAGDDPSRMRFPASRYCAQCSPEIVLRFGQLPCGYQGVSVTGVTLSSTNPVAIAATAHRGSTGSVFALEDIAGITPSLDGSYTITRTGDDAFTLDGTDSSDYSGAYSGGGTAGFADCNGRYEDCLERGNAERFGGCPGIATRGIQIALR